MADSYLTLFLLFMHTWFFSVLIVSGVTDLNVSDRDVEHLYVEVNQYALVRIADFAVMCLWMQYI